MMRRLRQWLWYERGEGFAERGLWRPFPVAFVRVNGAFAASLIAILVGTFAVLLTPLAELFDLFSAPYSVLVVFVPQLLFGPRQYRLKQFMKRDVVAARGLVCPRCLYDLRGAGAISACPECGQSVDLEKLPRQWARTVRGLRYPDGDREAVTGWRDV